MTIKDLYSHIAVMLDKHGDKHVETVEIVYDEGIEKITVSFKHTVKQENDKILPLYGK